MWKSAIATSFGASLGASLRWLTGIKLNSLFRAYRSGILAASLIDACLFGFGMRFSPHFPRLHQNGVY